MGGKSSSKSSAQTTTTTNTTNQDNRMAIESGIGVNAEGSNINVQALDADIVAGALDVVKNADAVAGAGFSQLLTLADKLFTGAGAAVQTTQETALEAIKSVNTAANDSKGSIDQKTMIVLGLAAAGAYAAAKMGKGK